MNIIEAKAYYEKTRISTSNISYKTAVLKVRYDNGTWQTIYRHVLNNRKYAYIEEYKGMDLEQIKQVSCLINDKDEKIFKLYFRKYLKEDMNINTLTVNSDLKLYVENKRDLIKDKVKLIIKQISSNASKSKVCNSNNVTNI